jgi:hypothetical protein
MRALLAVLLLGLAAHAEPLRRVAVVVGANRGALGRGSLRYSYSDAEQFAAVLTQVGQFAAEDVHVLRDPEPEEVLAELDRGLAGLKPGSESLVVFYYSGHADSQALYPNGKPLSFAELRPRLESQAATVRIGIIDACSGGGWTGAKGFHPSAPFVVDVPLQLTSEGSVLIASSSGVEKAHESESVYGSFFTHHLIAALRGAANQSGDGVVTLNDAFAYARERTIRDSAAVADPQHPSFSMNLRGRSDLPLTRVAEAKTVMELSETEGPLQLIHLGSGLVVMEVPAGKRTIKLSVPAGRYLLRRQQAGGNYSREIVVEPDKTVTVDEAELVLSPLPRDLAKGSDDGEPPALPGVWPIAVNDRPLTLYKGMTEVGLGLSSARTTVNTVDLSAGNAPSIAHFTSVSAVPGVRYGVSDRLSLGLNALALKDFCSGNAVLCGDLVYGFAGNAAYLLVDKMVELAAVGSASVFKGQSGGATGVAARIGRGLPVSLEVTSTLSWSTTLPSRIIVDFTGFLLVQPLKRLSFDVSTALAANTVALTTPIFGATVTLRDRVDLRGTLQWGAQNNLASGVLYESSSAFSAGLAVLYRP